MNALATSSETTSMDSEQTGWVAGGFATTLAIIAWARDFTRGKRDREREAQQHDQQAKLKSWDLNKNLAEQLMARVEHLEAQRDADHKAAELRENALRGRVTQVESESRVCQDEYTKLNRQYEEAVEKYLALREQIETLEAELGDTKRQLAETRAELEEVAKQRDALRKELFEAISVKGLQRSPSDPRFFAVREIVGRDVTEPEMTTTPIKPGGGKPTLKVPTIPAFPAKRR